MPWIPPYLKLSSRTAFIQKSATSARGIVPAEFSNTVTTPFGGSTYDPSQKHQTETNSSNSNSNTYRETARSYNRPLKIFSWSIRPSKKHLLIILIQSLEIKFVEQYHSILRSQNKPNASLLVSYLVLEHISHYCFHENLQRRVIGERVVHTVVRIYASQLTLKYHGALPSLVPQPAMEEYQPLVLHRKILWHTVYTERSHNCNPFHPFCLHCFNNVCSPFRQHCWSHTRSPPPKGHNHTIYIFPHEYLFYISCKLVGMKALVQVGMIVYLKISCSISEGAYKYTTYTWKLQSPVQLRAFGRPVGYLHCLYFQVGFSASLGHDRMP